MLDSTGSDWCGWCIKLHKEVFSQPEFAAYAKKNLVCVEVDSPIKKKLSVAQQTANDDLAKKYKIEGYPTPRRAQCRWQEDGRIGLCGGRAQGLDWGVGKADEVTAPSAHFKRVRPQGCARFVLLPPQGRT